MRDKVDFVGPIVRKSEYTQKDRSRIRDELRIGPTTKLIVVMAGSVLDALFGNLLEEIVHPDIRK